MFNTNIVYVNEHCVTCICVCVGVTKHCVQLDDGGLGHSSMEQRDSDHSEEMDRMKTEKEALEMELQQWAEQTQALREEEAGVERESRRIQQEERQIRKERERLERKLRLSQKNSTNHQHSLSFIIPLEK